MKKRLPSTCSIFNAELYAIHIALKFITKSSTNDHVIFSYCLSALQFLDNKEMDHKIKVDIIKTLNSTRKNITLEWVPGHSDIQGNVLADTAAKESLQNDTIVKLPLIYGDYKTVIKEFINKQWQLQWSIFGTCRLKRFKPIMGD